MPCYALGAGQKHRETKEPISWRGREGLGLSVQAQEISGPEIFIRADAAPAVTLAVSDGTGGLQ